MSIIASLVIASLVMAILAVGYAALAARIAQRHTPAAVVPLWALASALVTGAFVWRLALVQRGLTVPPFAAAPFPVFWHFLALYALGFGAVSLVVTRRHRRGRTGVDVSLGLRSIGAFFGGVVVWMLAQAAWDARRLF